MGASRLIISDEERRNMASSLRHDAAYSEGSLSEWWGRLQFIVLDEEGFPSPREVFEGLADLIDPTPTTGETSDGYHTFNELYHHRAVLFSVIVATFPEKAWKAKKHRDSTMYDGMFIVGIETPDGQATYHYDISPYWDMFRCKEIEFAPEWDGHTPAQAIERIGKLADLTDRPTCRNVYDESEMGSCKNGFKCSECGNIVEDCEGYCVIGTFNYCSECGRDVVE